MKKDYASFFQNLNDKKINISKDPDRYNKDYSNLPDDSFIQYGKDYDMFCKKEEFIKYQECLLKIKEKANFKKLSPVEKLLITYDIVRVKQYKMSGDTRADGWPHKILFSDYIVCRGYCNLMIELLAGEEIKIISHDLLVFDKTGEECHGYDNGHSRCLVLIDDEKYNIHGLYDMGPTEDSYNEEYKDSLGSDLKPTDLYCNFLKPLRDSSLYYGDDYQCRILGMFADDEIELEPVCYDNPENKLNDLIENNDLENLTFLRHDVLKGLIEGLTKEEILAYVNAKYISFDLLLEIIKNVRKINGNTEEEISIELDRIRRINFDFFPTEKNEA